MKKSETTIWLLLFNYKWVFLVLVVSLILVKDYVVAPTDPMDVGYPMYKSVDNIIVADSKDNGFMVSFMTTDQVTDKRLEYIQGKSDVKRFMYNIEVGAITEELDLLHMDIYTFLDWMLSKGIPNDIYIYEITGVGKDKHLLYLQPNPSDSTYITNVPLSSNQGIIFINNIDIKNHINGYESDVYRYIDCLANSNIDERFSHISSITPLQR